jgi:hypothetical protein
MWRPVSALTYRALDPNAQAIVVCCPVTSGPFADFDDRWRPRAAAVIHDSPLIVRDVVRDLLANPQIRAVAFVGECCGRSAYAEFWEGIKVPPWGIDGEHVALVRQFVDLYDGDFALRGPQQPFWPSRVMYLQ